ncbi:MAG: adenylate/guanylate cyclase domain-containing protein [Proteobacteria bacterium]|nr:adenylate/guanylate cyclase domain-containing protein [Pseudomonadota bacterium]
MMRIGIRLAISGLVLASIVVAAGGVHALWWQTASASTRELAATINSQIVAAVEREILSIADQARAAHTSIRTLFLQNVLETREADKREFVLLSQLQAHPTLSWIAFGWPDGSFFAAHRLGDRELEMMEISVADGADKRRADRYKVITGDIEFETRSFERTDFVVTRQQWYEVAIKNDIPRWLEVSNHPVGERRALAYAGPIDVYTMRQGVLAIMIEYARLSRFLSRLAVGKSGAAFIIGQSGMTIAAPDPAADELHAQRSTPHPLLAAAHRALRLSEGVYDPDFGPARSLRVSDANADFTVSLAPLAFPGWTLATVIPQAELTGAVDATIRRLLVGLALLVVVAGIVSAYLARRIIATPLVKVAAELRHVERFELERVRRHPSRLSEIENLSTTIADMASGLSAFRKYIPAELVKSLVSRGIAAHPGGAIRPMTVMFSDIAGFTGMSERLGEDVIPLLSRYLEIMSTQVSGQRGTIDKFIGDAVMAFWGAPVENADHALDACRAALAGQQAIRAAGLADDNGGPLGVRIGVNSGDMLVGNIGSHLRLNYTVLGDAVNIASRLEAVNKEYGTEIIIGEETRRLAGAGIHARELDRLMVYGRAGGLRIFELVAMAAPSVVPPAWIATYERGLEQYRRRNFVAARVMFREVLVARKTDRAAQVMIERCDALIAKPPNDDWMATSAMRTK